MLQQNKEKNSEEEKQRQGKEERANESDNEFNNKDVEQEVPPDTICVKRKAITKPHERKTMCPYPCINGVSSYYYYLLLLLLLLLIIYFILALPFYMVLCLKLKHMVYKCS